MKNKITVQDIINSGKISLEEIYEFIDGNLKTYESTQKILNEETGFKKCSIDLYTDEQFTESELLNAKLFDEQ